MKTVYLLIDVNKAGDALSPWNWNLLSNSSFRSFLHVAVEDLELKADWHATMTPGTLGCVETGKKFFHSPIIIFCARGAFRLSAKELPD